MKRIKKILSSLTIFFLTIGVFLYSFLLHNPKEAKLGQGVLQGDLNNDGRVDILDYQLLSNTFGKTQGQSGYNPSADFNSDTRVDILDFQILSNNFGISETSPSPTQGSTTTPPPPPPQGTGIWISQDQIMALPTNGPAWQATYSVAAGSWGTASVANQDSDHDQKVMAGALVCARTGEFCDKTRQGLLSAIGTENGARWLAIGRNMTGYTIASDLVRNSGRLTGTDLSRVSTWLASFLTRTLAHNNSGEQVLLEPFGSGSNASAQEGAVYAAIAAYTRNSTKLTYVWNRFRLYSCDRTNNPEQTINVQTGFNGGWSHTTNYNEACGINPRGATKNGHRIDGAIINDMVRGGNFTWPPGHTQYPWVGIEGYVPAALILHRAGFPAFQVKDQAVKRTLEYMCFLDNNTTTDWWNAGDSGRVAEGKHLVKVVYGSGAFSCPISYPTGPGRVVGFTDWTHPNSI